MPWCIFSILCSLHFEHNPLPGLNMKCAQKVSFMGSCNANPTFLMKETASLTFFGGLLFIFRILSFFLSPKKRLTSAALRDNVSGKRSPRGAEILLTSPLRVSPGHKTRHKDPSVLLRFGWLLLWRINANGVHRKSVETINNATSSYVWEISEGPTWAK